MQLIDSARKEILIANAYFVPTPGIIETLHEAERRCVAITLLTNSPQTNDLPEITMVGRGHYKTLLRVNGEAAVSECNRPAAGIQIWEWQGKKAGREQDRRYHAQ